MPFIIIVVVLFIIQIKSKLKSKEILLDQNLVDLNMHLKVMIKLFPNNNNLN